MSTMEARVDVARAREDAIDGRDTGLQLWQTEYAVTNAKTKRTEIRRATILAKSRQEVVVDYDKIGATAISVKPASLQSKVWSAVRPPNPKALIDFFRAYHSLYKLVDNAEILEIASEECGNPRLKAVLEEMTIEVIDGATISSACARRPQEFSPTLVALLRAGERGARNTEILGQLTKMLANRAQFRQELISTASYPVFIMVCLLLFVIVMGSFVAPKIQQATDTATGGLGTPPGGMLGLISGVAGFLTSPFAMLLLAVVIVAAIAGGIVYGQTREGRSNMGAWSLKVPLVGAILQKIAEAQFARTYGTLASALIPAEAFRLAIPAAGHPTYVEKLAAIYPQVLDGQKASTLLKASKLFSRRFTSVLYVGEKSKTIPNQMMTFAEETEREVTMLLQALSKPLQGALYVVAGALTLAIALPVMGQMLNYFHAILPAPAGPVVPTAP